MTSININEVLEQLKDCEVREWDLKQLMIRGVQFTFKPDIYLKEDQIVLKTNVSDSFDATMEQLVERFDTFQNAIKWHNLKYMCSRVSLLDNEKNEISIRRWEGLGTLYPEIVQLVQYTVLNEFDKDLTKVHEITDALRIKNGYIYEDPEAVKFEVLGIEIQAYKNRKTIIRGLTDKQHDRIVNAFKFYEKYKL